MGLAARVWAAVMAWLRVGVDRGVERFEEVAGGERRAAVLALLAGILALDTADISMIGAVASKLEHSLSLSNTKLGLLAAVPAFVAAFATIPVGLMTDRLNRVRLAALSTLVWSATMVLSGLAGSYGSLLLYRIALGAGTATAGPVVASLVGDFFAPGERGRMYGIILSGEVLGAGLGFVVSGLFAGFGWRAPFFVMAIPSLALTYALVRYLPEPARGGRGRLEPEILPADPAEAASATDPSVVQQKVEEAGVAPNPRLVLHEDPVRMSLADATRYLLGLRSNVILIVASGLGYFYLGGIQTFGLEFLKGHFHIGQAVGTFVLAVLLVGGVVGVLVGGRLSDRLVHRGMLNGRLSVAGFASILAAVLFVPAVITHDLLIAGVLFFVAAAGLTAVNPALDAARLDLVHHRLWGRAEAVRTFLRQLLVGVAPLMFGIVADVVVRARGSGNVGPGGQTGFGAGTSAPGLEVAFLIMLVSLLAAGVLTLRARRDYPQDVATALASERATRRRIPAG